MTSPSLHVFSVPGFTSPSEGVTLELGSRIRNIAEYWNNFPGFAQIVESWNPVPEFGISPILEPAILRRNLRWMTRLSHPPRLILEARRELKIHNFYHFKHLDPVRNPELFEPPTILEPGFRMTPYDPFLLSRNSHIESFYDTTWLSLVHLSFSF